MRYYDMFIIFQMQAGKLDRVDYLFYTIKYDDILQICGCMHNKQDYRGSDGWVLSPHPPLHRPM